MPEFTHDTGFKEHEEKHDLYGMHAIYEYVDGVCCSGSGCLVAQNRNRHVRRQRDKLALHNAEHQKQKNG